MARMAGSAVELDTAAQGIMIAVAINTIAKGVMTSWVGGWAIGARVIGISAVALSCSAAAAWWVA
jgi:hypothetical protein